MRSTVRALAVISLMAFGAVWLTRPLAAGMSDHVLNFGDALHPVVVLDHNFQVMMQWRWRDYWQAPMFTPYPYSTTLADPHLGTALWTWPVYWLTGSALFAHNVAIIGGFFLTGIGGYLLASQFTARRWLAAAIGLAAMAVPFRLAQVEHMHLAMTQWLLLSLWSLLRCVRQPHGGYVALFGVTFLLTLFSSVYYGLFQVLLFGPVVAFLGVRYGWYRLSVLLRPWLWTGFFVCVSSVVFLIPFYIAQGLEGFGRDLADVRRGSARLGDFLNVTPRHWARLVPALGAGPVELALFPGFALSLAAIWYALLHVRRANWRQAPTRLKQRMAEWLGDHRPAWFGYTAAAWLVFTWLFMAPFRVWIDLKYDFISLSWRAVSFTFLALLAVAVLLTRLPGAIRSGWIRARSIVFWSWCGIGVFALLSLGPVISWGNWELAIGPYALLYRFVPGFHNMQVPGRLFVLVLPLAIVVASSGVEMVLESAWPLRARRAAIAATAAGLVADLAVSPYQFLRVPLEPDLPAAVRWLRDDGKPGAVLMLPTDTIERQRSAYYLYLALYHRRPMLNGYASFVPSDCATALEQASSFPSGAAIHTLRRRGVRYVVIDRQEMEYDVGAERWNAIVHACDTSEAVRRVDVPNDARYLLYEIIESLHGYPLTGAPATEL